MKAHQKFSSILLFLLLIFLILPDIGSAQFFSFGKNRVQYEDFDWRYIQTEHFDIYYYEEKNYHFAQFTAEALESGLRQLSEDFQHTLNSRIPVVIYDSHSDFSQTNVVDLPVDAQGIGGVTDKLKNRMTQPFMGDYMDFRRTLQHELAHAIVNDMFYGGGFQSIVSNNIQLQFPLWFEEGLAEYLALGWDTQTDMYIRDAVINNYLPPLQQLTNFFAYRGGQAFWNFIEEEYGRSKITEILQRIRTSRSVQAGLVQSTGLSIQELSTRWEDYLQQRYFPEVAEREPLSQVASRVTDRETFGSYNTSPAISPQGDRIAFISNRRGVFDVVVVSSITGERLKTVIRGEDNPMFEELNILNPNLSWSPDGSQIALSSKSDGAYNLAIVDYESGSARRIRFPMIDAINSVAWAPNGQKIAFDGNVGPYQSIFVYDLQTETLTNLTNDVFTDKEPAWGPDSETVYFVSNRGDRLTPGQHLAGYSIMQHDFAYETDIYSIRLGDNRISRVTQTNSWSETQPAATANGQLFFISDQNGIPNIYEFDMESRTAYPITDIRTGVIQLSVTADGSRAAFNSLNEGYLDVFLMRAPSDRRKEAPLTPNYWAQRRLDEPQGQRVPATEYAKQMIRAQTVGNAVAVNMDETPLTTVDDSVQVDVDDDGTLETLPENVPEDTTGTGAETIDFRNYVFGESVINDSTLQLQDDPRLFQPVGNLTDAGNYQPKSYRLKFSPDLRYTYGQLDTYYGGSAYATLEVSDLLGNHRLSLGTNLVTDLRNSDYIIQYGYFGNRTNFMAHVFHQSQNYQTFFGELLRFRTYGGGIDFQYPFNRYERIDYGITAIGISRDFSSISGIGERGLSNENSFFFYPQVTYTADYSIYDSQSITPVGGRRYSLRLSGSPGGLSNSPQFFSLLGDYRKYLNMGSGYSFAVRASGAASIGRDSQTFFMGGMLGWINQKWSGNDIPYDRLADTFFTLPATPLRGHEYNTLYGNKFSLVNAEFRFPLFAAILPGPIPVLPLYNITGAAFVDAGSAWGFDINYSLYTNSQTGEPVVYYEKPGQFNFKVSQRNEVYINPDTGLIRQGEPQDGDVLTSYVDGDILIGAGFSLRTIFLGLPFRYDVGWAYDRDGFRSRPIHYFSIGIDF